MPKLRKGSIFYKHARERERGRERERAGVDIC